MVPFWRGRKLHEPKSTPSLNTSSSSAFESELETDLRHADVGRGTQYRIFKEEWFGRGERYEPDERQVKLPATSMSCEFLETCRRQDERRAQVPSIVIETIGKRINYELSLVTKNFEGPDVETSLENEFLWHSKTVEVEEEVPLLGTKTLTLQKIPGLVKETAKQTESADIKPILS